MNRIFRGGPSTLAPEEISQALRADPEVLGKGWKLLGREEGRRGGPPRLLFAAPPGELVLCLVAPVVDTALLSRGLALLGGARQAVSFLGSFQVEGWPPLEKARLLLLGGLVEKEVLDAAGPEVTFLLAVQVEGQPGPPLVLIPPPFRESAPFAEEKEPSPPRPQPQPGDEAPPSPGRPPLDDDEVARLIS